MDPEFDQLDSIGLYWMEQGTGPMDPIDAPSPLELDSPTSSPPTTSRGLFKPIRGAQLIVPTLDPSFDYANDQSFQFGMPSDFNIDDIKVPTPLPRDEQPVYDHMHKRWSFIYSHTIRCIVDTTGPESLSNLLQQQVKWTLMYLTYKHVTTINKLRDEGVDALMRKAAPRGTPIGVNMYLPLTCVFPQFGLNSTQQATLFFYTSHGGGIVLFREAGHKFRLLSSQEVAALVEAMY